MHRIYALIFIIIAGSHLQAVAQTDIRYYLPETFSYDSIIPRPESVIGHQVGDFHVTHDRLVNYMQALDRASDRISLSVTGYTHEGRPILLMIITSPDNHKNLESIRTQHLQLSDFLLLP